MTVRARLAHHALLGPRRTSPGLEPGDLGWTRLAFLVLGRGSSLFTTWVSPQLRPYQLCHAQIRDFKG